jgi:NAD(P)-dependent dehydrogenase (short-subunit alcohol dehydrogenase family)
MSLVLREKMLIATGSLSANGLSGRVVLVTGAGGGIGFEAARSLLGLGACVVIAEIDEACGRDAEARLAATWTDDRILFVPADVADEASVVRIREAAERRFGKVDVVLNNATFSPVGTAVVETPIATWDRSYAVNLRGPVLLARAFLPAMIARKSGAFICVSSTGGPFLAPYETVKAAQLALANSLDAELAGTGVIAFTIGPGLVPTRTATDAVNTLAPRLGMTVEDFWAQNAGAVLSVEAAGAGFAAAVALASRYAGQEISSSQALIDAGIELPAAQPSPSASAPAFVRDPKSAAQACEAVLKTLAEQSAGWQQRSFFERQWMQRDFKHGVGKPAERCLETLESLGPQLAAGDPTGFLAERPTLEKLAGYYGHLAELARGYVKDPLQREEQLRIIGSWRAEVERLLGVV